MDDKDSKSKQSCVGLGEVTRGDFLHLLSTCSLSGKAPVNITVVFPASVFDVPGAFDIRVDLLYDLENEFQNWSARRVSGGSAKVAHEAAFIVEITDVWCPAEMEAARRIFSNTLQLLADLQPVVTVQLR